MEYLWLKAIHIISAMLLFGTGLGSAFYKFMTYRSDSVQAIAVTDRLVVLADWLFTTPSVIVQLLTGLWMVYLAQISVSELWVLAGLSLYGVAGICWLPVVFLQIRMKKISTQAAQTGASLTQEYRQMMKVWLRLGYPALIVMLLIFYLMIFKPTW